MITKSIRNASLFRKKSAGMLALPFALLIAAFIKFKFLSQPSLWPDEALYLFISRNLSSNPFDLKDMSGGIFYQSPPLLMYLLSLFEKLPLADFERTARTVVALMGTATVYLTYLIGRKLYHPVVGLMAAGFLAVCPLNNWIGVRILTDTPVVFFIYLAICMLLHERRAAFYLFGICAVLTKYSAFPVLLLPFLSGLRPRIWAWGYAGLFLLLGGFVAVKAFLPAPGGWPGYFYHFFQMPEPSQVAAEAAYFLGGVVMLLAIVGLAAAVRQRQFSALFHWFCLFAIFRLFLPWVVFRVSRYTLPLYPALFVFAALGTREIVRFASARWPAHKRLAVFFFGVAISSVLFHHTMKSLDILGKTRDTFTGFKEAAAFIRSGPAPHRIATASPRQMKYFGPEFEVRDMPPDISAENLRAVIERHRITYLVIDLWSPHLPAWCRDYPYAKNGYVMVHAGQNVFVFKTR